MSDSKSTAQSRTSKPARDDLRGQAEAYFRSIVEAVPMGMHMYRLEADDRLIFMGANSAAEKILGVDHRQFVGKMIEEAFPTLAETEVPERYRRAAATGEAWQTDQVVYEENQIVGAFEVNAFQTTPGEMVAAFLDITERKQTEAELRKLSRAVEQSANTVVITDTKGYIEYANPKFSETTGYSREEAIGQHTRILKSGETSPDEYKALWETIATGNEWQGEFHNKRKNGELYWEMASISPIKDEQGNVTHYLAVKEDITARKEAEEALRESEERFRTIYEGTQDAVMLLSPEGFFDCNIQTLELFGFDSKEEFTAVHPADVSPPFQPDGRESMPAALERIQTAYKQGHHRFEWVHRRTNGEDFPAEVLLTAFELGGEAVLQATVRDISERKQAEAAVRESQQMLQLIMNNIPQSIFWKDKGLVYLGCNQNFADDAGLDRPEEVIGKTDFDMPWLDQAELYRADDSRVMESDEAVLNYEEPQTTPDGSQIWLRTSKIPLHDADGSVMAVLGMYENITESKQTEAELQRYRDELEEQVEARTAELESRLNELHGLQRLMTREGWQDFQASRAQATPGYLFDQAAVRPVQREELEISANGQTQAESPTESAADKTAGHKAVTKPLAVSGESIGLLGIYDDDPNQPLSVEDQAFLDEVATQVAEALERARLLEQSRAALEETESLYRASRRIQTADDFDEMLAVIIEEGPVPTFRQALLELFERDAAGEVESLLVAASWHSGTGAPPPPAGTRLPVANLTQQDVLLSAEPVFVSDVEGDERLASEVKDALLQQDIRATAMVPLWGAELQLGGLFLGAGEVHQFTESEIEPYMALSRQVAAVIENRRLLEEARRALEEVEATQRRYTVQAWEAYRDKRRASSYEEDREGVPPLGEQLPPEVTQAVADKKPVAITAPPALTADSNGQAQEASTGEAKASLTVPLTVRNELIGVLGLQSIAEAKDWTPEEIALVEAIAEQVAQAAEQIRLFDETQQRAAREQRVGEIGDKIRAAQSLEEALQVAIKEVGLSLKAPQTRVELGVE